MIRSIRIDEATTRRLERHETMAHAIPSRRVRDLGDAMVLYDPRDPDPFWNRMVSVRWPDEPAAFDHRLNEAITMFALDARQPHIWPSPDHNAPADLALRLERAGFRDVGGGHLMVLADASACPPLEDRDLEPRVTVTGICGPGDAGERDIDDIAAVLAEAFGAPSGRAEELAADLWGGLDDPRVSLALVRVDGDPAAVAKASAFDRCIYLSSIATREAHRGRGLAGLATRHVVALAGGASGQIVYLGVFTGNLPAIHLYERLGFASTGEAPDMLLE